MMSDINDQMTLREARLHMLESPNMDPILGLVKINRRVRVRFIFRPDGTEFDDGTTVGEFKSYAVVGEAYIVIDDGEGGVSQPVDPEPVS